jgi:hypothetical protein
MQPRAHQAQSNKAAVPSIERRTQVGRRVSYAQQFRMWKEETPAAARYPSLMMAGHIGEEKQPKPKRNTVWTNRLSVS